jgi:hypothetical protein
MKGMSEREYSAHTGLSRGAIQKARKSGRLVVYGDGSINAAASDTHRAEMTDPDQQRRSTGGDVGFSVPVDSSCYLKARTAMTVYQAQVKQLAIQKRKSPQLEQVVLRSNLLLSILYLSWSDSVFLIYLALALNQAHDGSDPEPKWKCCISFASRFVNRARWCIRYCLSRNSFARVIHSKGDTEATRVWKNSDRLVVTSGFLRLSPHPSHGCCVQTESAL